MFFLHFQPDFLDDGGLARGGEELLSDGVVCLIVPLENSVGLGDYDDTGVRATEALDGLFLRKVRDLEVEQLELGDLVLLLLNFLEPLLVYFLQQC